jgi:hypothetical protein
MVGATVLDGKRMVATPQACPRLNPIETDYPVLYTACGFLARHVAWN